MLFSSGASKPLPNVSAIIDNLFTQISSLVHKLVELQNLPKSKEQIFLISKMFQVQNEFEVKNTSNKYIFEILKNRDPNLA